MSRKAIHFIALGTEPHISEYVESMTMIPITQLTLATLTPPGYEVRILDEALGPLTPEPCDLAAISVIYFNAKRAYQLAAWYRERGIPVIMGGPHATLCPDEVQAHADSLVVGEADEIWPAILDDFERGRLRPRYQADRPPDLTRLPLTRHHWVDKSKYAIQNLVQTGRGCPYGCDFCAIPVVNGLAPRHKTVGQVVGEIQESLRTSRGRWNRLVFFSDDNIVSDPAYARELFAALVPLRIWWASQCSLNIAYDQALLDLAYASGCRGLFIGFETSSQAALREVKKNYAASSFPDCIRRIRERGIFLLGSFIFGLDADTSATFDETLDFCLRNRVDFVNYHIVSPTPGTPFFQRLKDAGRLLHEDWTYYQENAVYRPAGMTVRELQEGQMRIYQAFFSAGNIARRAGAYWRSPVRLLVLLAESLRFRGIVRRDTARQRIFLERYNRELLGLDKL